jgi:hypothetical protein
MALLKASLDYQFLTSIQWAYASIMVILVTGDVSLSSLPSVLFGSKNLLVLLNIV